MKTIAFLIAFSVLLGFTASAAPAAARLHAAILAGADADVIKAGGQKADVSAITSKKYLLIYFSAHWCPPCRAFTPHLVQFYNQEFPNNDFELLFVSSDHSQAQMDQYMSEMKMPWIGLNRKSSAAKAIKARFGGKGIPCLVLLDEQDHVLATSYDGEKYLGPGTATRKYLSLHQKRLVKN